MSVEIWTLVQHKVQCNFMRNCNFLFLEYDKSHHQKSLPYLSPTNVNKDVRAWCLILQWMRVQDNDDLCITSPLYHFDFNFQYELWAYGRVDRFLNVAAMVLTCTADTLIITCSVCSVRKDGQRWGKCPEDCRYAVKRARNSSSTSPSFDDKHGETCKPSKTPSIYLLTRINTILFTQSCLFVSCNCVEFDGRTQVQG